MRTIGQALLVAGAVTVFVAVIWGCVVAMSADFGRSIQTPDRMRLTGIFFSVSSRGYS